MAVALNCCGALRSRENAFPESEEIPACGAGDLGEGGVALSPSALSLSAPDLFVSLFAVLSVDLSVLGPPFNPEGTMTGKLPTVDGDFGAAPREVEVEEAVFGEVEFETSATRLDDWPKVSAAAADINSAAAGSSVRTRRKLLILYLQIIGP